MIVYFLVMNSKRYNWKPRYVHNSVLKRLTIGTWNEHSEFLSGIRELGGIHKSGVSKHFGQFHDLPGSGGPHLCVAQYP